MHLWCFNTNLSLCGLQYAKEMRRSGLPLGLGAYKVLMNAQAATGAVDRVQALLDEVQAQGRAPDGYCWSALVNALRVAGQMVPQERAQRSQAIRDVLTQVEADSRAINADKTIVRKTVLGAQLALGCAAA